MQTERLRVKTIIVTLAVLLAILLVCYAIWPEAIDRIWHGHLPVLPLTAVFVPFILFELWVLRQLRRGWSRAATCPMRAAISAS